LLQLPGDQSMSEPVTLFTAELGSPIGPLALAASPVGLCWVGFDADRGRMRLELERRFGPVVFQRQTDPAGAGSALHRYFEGDVRAIETIPVDIGGTPFQQQVWTTLRRIPAGRTWSYANMAAAIGRPTATRAVGAANGANPVGVVLPCHRVIGSNGSLTGYGGGLPRKVWLLRHEGVLL
jgi:methylated-DNA-[protein]-cysteine S-methyltransferase